MDKVELLNQIFSLCIVPLLGILTTFIVALLRKKAKELDSTIDNDLLSKYVQMLIEIVVSCVITTNQTYVDELKDKNAFDEKAQAEAFRMTYENVMSLLNEQAKKVLKEAYGDLPLLVTQLIEQKVAENK